MNSSIEVALCSEKHKRRKVVAVAQHRHELGYMDSLSQGSIVGRSNSIYTAASCLELDRAPPRRRLSFLSDCDGLVPGVGTARRALLLPVRRVLSRDAILQPAQQAHLPPDCASRR